MREKPTHLSLHQWKMEENYNGGRSMRQAMIFIKPLNVFTVNVIMANVIKVNGVMVNIINLP